MMSHFFLLKNIHFHYLIQISLFTSEIEEFKRNKVKCALLCIHYWYFYNIVGEDSKDSSQKICVITLC